MAESLATKYRPQTFGDVVGQENIVQILTNQIKTEAPKQAYLFCGGAGTGKTTIARIFARALNVVGGEISEIDAASNNGVDNVRDLRDNCKFKPMGGGRRVYIIDEVHMLSTGAFNALLKTLEEPPAHAVFILCTTDPQKIPSTILSRVQRFDYKRMTSHQIIGRLMLILDNENAEMQLKYADEALDDNESYFDVEPEALEYIAKLANGGMRDSISLLDTCLGYGGVITAKRVSDILGKADYSVFVDLLTAIHAGEAETIIHIIEAQHTNGKDLKALLKGMIEFVVELRKLSLLGDFDYVNVPGNHYEDMATLISATGDAWLATTFKSLVELTNMIKFEHQPKTLILGVLMSYGD